MYNSYSTYIYTQWNITITVIHATGLKRPYYRGDRIVGTNFLLAFTVGNYLGVSKGQSNKVAVLVKWPQKQGSAAG